MARRATAVSVTVLALAALCCESKRAQQQNEVPPSVPDAVVDAAPPDQQPTSKPSKGTIYTETPVLIGSLGKDVIRRVTRRNIAQLRRCYERELIEHPELSGKVVVKYVIAVNGRVTNVKIEQSSLNNSSVLACIEKQLLTWRFPPPEGGVVVVNYPFVFNAK